MLNRPVVLRRVAGKNLRGDGELLGGADKEPGREDGAIIVPEPQARRHLGEAPIALDDRLLQRVDRLHGPTLAGDPSASTFTAPASRMPTRLESCDMSCFFLSASS